MAYRIMKQIQTQLNVPGDTTTHVIVYMECDSTSDLPATPTSITGLTLEIGSRAHIIEDNTIWMMTSSGTWYQQDEASRMNVYTKPEIDDMIDDENRHLDLLFRSGCKNILNVWGQTSQLINGIQWTINNDGTVRANGLATADSALYIWRNAFPPPQINYPIMITGLPAGSSGTTYDIAYTSTASGTVSITSDREIVQNVASTTTRLALRVYSGNNVDILFEPMVIRKDVYQVSPGFAPYAPTNAELYQMIRSYHP